MQILARFRVALGWVFAPLVLIVADPNWSSIVVGGAVAFVGEAVRVWAAGHLNKGSEVTSSGPYRFFAHPLYVGSSIIGVGIALASASPIAAVLIAFYLATTLRAAIKSEETLLRRRFGEQYELYRLNRSSAPHTWRPFSFSRAIAVNREYRAVLGLVAAILMLALKATYNGAFWRAAGP